MTRIWKLTEEAPNEDGTPTGLYFVSPFRLTGDVDVEGEPESEPDHTVDALGPYGPRIASGIATKKNRAEMAVNLPKKGDSPLEICAHGKTLTVVASGREWLMRLNGRARWGNRGETLSDIAHFQDVGAMPPRRDGWA